VSLATSTDKATSAERKVGPAMARGALCRCPHCGEGRLFRAYLKVVDQCDVCGEEFHMHRADDLPPYVAIFIVGHLLVGVMLHLDMVWKAAPMVYLSVLLPLAIILPMLMLPSIKGSIVGLQWAMRMHGFAGRSGEKMGQ